MATAARLNIVSKEYTGNTTFPFKQDRGYFLVAMGNTAGTVELGAGGGKITLASNSEFEPNVCPTSEITIETLGSYVVALG